jgi:hypothetical protein
MRNKIHKDVFVAPRVVHIFDELPDAAETVELSA